MVVLTPAIEPKATPVDVIFYEAVSGCPVCRA